MKKKEVLFLCQFFYPEYNSSATLPWDTARYLVKHQFSVTALCGYPKEYCHKTDLPLREMVEGVEICRLKYWQLSRKHPIGRMMNFFSFTLAILLRLPLLKNYRCIMVYSNPPILPIAAVLSKLFFGNRIIFVSYDVYPEVAYASNSLKASGFLARLMHLFNRWLFKYVDYVVALTDEMRQFLVLNRPQLSYDQVEVIPNWAHESFSSSMAQDKNKQLFAELGWSEDSFVVSYFGNMGICQEMTTLLAAIRNLQNHPKIRFLIAGHGSKKAWVEEQTKDFANVVVLDFLTGTRFTQALEMSACSVVSLERGLKGLCAPSKYYSYLQAGLPIISITEKDSYLAKEVIEEQIGLSIVHGESQKLVSSLTEWAVCPEVMQAMCRKTKALYQKKYAKKHGLKHYEYLIRKVIENDEKQNNRYYFDQKRIRKYPALYRVFKWLS